MKEVAVLSGKGGTGKTTLLAGFAALAERAVLADCDVDAPNLHLVLSGRRIEEGPFSGSQVASVDPAGCTLCRRCAEACRFGAVHLGGPAGPFIDPLSCEGCGLCWRLCPAHAIAMTDRPSGRWMVSRTSAGTMFHARLEPGEANSGKLVSLLKRMARAHGAAAGSPLMLVDGPPGIGCAAIAALSGADLAVLVAEPTRSCLSDLERIVRLCRQMNIPPALVLNRWDISPPLAGRIEELCRQEEVALLGRIPFDDKIFRSMSAGVAVMKKDAPASRSIREAWEKVKGLL